MHILPAAPLDATDQVSPVPCSSPGSVTGSPAQRDQARLPRTCQAGLPNTSDPRRLNLSGTVPTGPDRSAAVPCRPSDVSDRSLNGVHVHRSSTRTRSWQRRHQEKRDRVACRLAGKVATSSADRAPNNSGGSVKPSQDELTVTEDLRRCPPARCRLNHQIRRGVRGLVKVHVAGDDAGNV